MRPESGIAEQLRLMVIDGSREMHSIASSVRTVEDAEAAGPRIRRMISDMIHLFGKLTTQLRSVTLREMYELRTMGRILEDPELVEWREKAEAAILELEERDPKAAAVMWEAGTDYDSRLMETMTNLLVGLDKPVFNDSIAPLYRQSELIGEYRAGLLAYCRNITGIMEKIRTVRDAERAGGVIGEEAEVMEGILWNLLEKADRIPAAEKRTLGQAMKDVLTDPDLRSCSRDAVAARDALGARSAKAGERFDEINREESEEFEEMSRELVEFLVDLGETE